MEYSTGKIIDIKGNDFLPLLFRISTLSEDERINEFKPVLFCSDRGKIRSFFWLKKTQEDHYNILCFDSENFTQSTKILEVLEYFRFQEKFELMLRLDHSYASFHESHEKIELDKNHFFYLQNTPDSSFHSKRIELGIPWPGNEFLEETQNPLDLGFSTLLRKKAGCYPGQEVFEKTLSLSEPAKKLCIFELQKGGSLSAPESLFSGDQKAGVLTSYDSKKMLGLGVISKIFTKPNQTFQAQEAKAIMKKEVHFEF